MSDLAALVAAAREMLPEGVGLGWADPRLEHEVLPAERLPRAVPKRQREFSAGRAAARMALQSNDPLPMAPDRAPIWPPSWVGSISHSDTACLAIAAPEAHFRGLGLDLEPATPLERDLWEIILRPAEFSRLLEQDTAMQGLTAKLIFSAKEAVYKAKHPITKCLFGFEVLHLSVTEETFIARFESGVSGFPMGSTVQGQWRQAGGHFLTLVALPA